ncbi:MAG: hypothetical protein AAGD22_07535 [Verrucomicrobiota bacterium]
MALDEVLLGCCEIPVLRVYCWERPTVSFGYFEPLVNLPMEYREGQYDLVRRWTGGGVVVHGSDWTYSLIVPHRFLGDIGGTAGSYAAVHRAIGDLLIASGIEASIVDGDRKAGGVDCFVSPVRSDVMVGSQKVAGAAQRRTRAGMLHQGSIQGIRVPGGFARHLAERLAEEVRAVDGLERELEEKAADLALRKYGTAGWLEGASRLGRS